MLVREYHFPAVISEHLEPKGGEVTMEVQIKAKCNQFRRMIADIGSDVKSLMKHQDFDDMTLQTYDGQHGEMKANIMLTYRHLEDARMRIGKVLQAADDGVSILDKSEAKDQ